MRLTRQIQYYAEEDGLPRKQLDANICGVCGDALNLQFDARFDECVGVYICITHAHNWIAETRLKSTARSSASTRFTNFASAAGVFFLLYFVLFARSPYA